MRIAVCDDNPYDIEKVERVLEKMTSFDIDYDVFQNASSLLEQLENKEFYQIYLLDIEMPEITGLQLALKIREMDLKALFVFITSYDQYMKDTFRVVTFDFLNKPLQDQELEAVIFRASEYLNLTKQNFVFSYRQNQIVLNCDEVLFIEKSGRQAIIHTGDREFKANLTLAEIWNRLDKKLFAHTHASYIINLQYIREIQRDCVILKNGRELAISRAHKQSLKEKYMTFLLEGGAK